MSIAPIITFKAGICDADTSEKPWRITSKPDPGYIYLYSEDDLIHFCWRKRSDPADQPELDLVMIPTDGSFVAHESGKQTKASLKTDGRIFVLKFSSSSQRHFFWLQSAPQGRNGDPSHFSPRDLKIGDIVHRLLQGDEVNVQAEIAAISNGSGNHREDNDGDETMEDAGDSSQPPGGAGGAGPDATGGDVREEGEGAREGGADGARAATSGNVDAAAAVRNFLDSLKGRAGGGSMQAESKLYPMLSDLLIPPTTVPVIRDADEAQLDNLLAFLPPAVVVLSQQGDSGDSSVAEPTPAAVEAAKAAMSLGQKKALLEKVLRSPQFHQSLTSLTMALRDGGLPSVADALAISVENGGYIRGGGMPLGGGEAVEAFVEGVKKTVQEKK